jgi:hypothetical protein
MSSYKLDTELVIISEEVCAMRKIFDKDGFRWKAKLLFG